MGLHRPDGLPRDARGRPRRAADRPERDLHDHQHLHPSPSPSPDPDPDAEAQPHADAEAHADADPDGEAHADADTDADPDGEAHADPDAEPGARHQRHPSLRRHGDRGDRHVERERSGHRPGRIRDDARVRLVQHPRELVHLHDPHPAALRPHTGHPLPLPGPLQGCSGQQRGQRGLHVHHRDTEPDADADAEAHPDADAEAHPDADAEAHPDADAEAHPDADADAHPGPDADAHPGPDADAHPEPGAVGIPVPATIDATGTTDASSALYTWVRGVPDGSTIVFKSGGTYRMDQGLIVNGRRNLTFEGNGATLKSNGGTTEASSLLRVFGATGIVIRNITLVGNSPTPGIYRPGRREPTASRSSWAATSRSPT